MNLKQLFSVSMCLLTVLISNAQHRNLKGHIKTSEGKNVSNIQVTVFGKDITVTSDKNGEFALFRLPDIAFEIQLWSNEKPFDDSEVFEI